MRSTQQQSLLHGAAECFTRNPLPVLSLIVYMALRSSTIMPPDEEYPDAFLWAPAYSGWYDTFFVGSVCAAVAFRTVRVARATLVVLYVLLVAVLASLLGGYQFGNEFVSAGLTYYVRFAAAFLFAAWVVYRSGVETAESLIGVLFLVLAVMALFVYSLNLGSFNRIYASAMTVASFGQVAAVTCFLALMRRRHTMALIAGTFLLLTFSRTSIITLLLLVAIYVFHFRGTALTTKGIQVAGLSLLLLIGAAVLLQYGGPEFQGVLTRAFDWQEVSTLNGRLGIWSHALQLVESLRVPLTGVGFNAASSLLATNEFLLVDDAGQTAHAAHFHSIIFEYAFGFGLISVVIFVGLARRLMATFTARVYPAFFIFAFFVITQSIDFTFYRPKEVIMWSLLLGMADAQWRVHRQRGETIRHAEYSHQHSSIHT